MQAVPSGTIAMWSRNLVAIPHGWKLCDGTAGTPDLRDKFIVGAGDSYAVNDNGGQVNHDHDYTSSSHFHTISSGTDLSSGEGYNDFTDPEVVTGTTDEEDHLPPYHALYFIQKN